MKIGRKLIEVIVGALLTGCTAIEKTDTGWKYSSFMNRKTIAELSVSKDGSIKMKGYQSTQAENLGAVAEGVAKGLGKAVIP